MLPRGDGYGSRGVWQRRRVKQLLVADEVTDLVCETLWLRLVVGGLGDSNVVIEHCCVSS